MRSTDARWYSVPTPGYARPQAVPFAWWIEPRCASGHKNGNFRNGNRTADAIEERRWLRSLVQSFANNGTAE